MASEAGPDRSVEAQVAAPQLSDSELSMEETIYALTELNGDPDALSSCLEQAIYTLNDGYYGEAVAMISYGGDRLSQVLSDCGLDPSQCNAISGDYNKIVNPDQFSAELAGANILERKRILSGITDDADRGVDRAHESYNEVLDNRIRIYEEDIDASKENKKMLRSDLDTAQGNLDTQMASFDEAHNYGLTAQQAIDATDQQLFAAIYGDSFEDKLEFTTDADREIQRRMIRGRRDMLKQKIEPLKVAQAQVDEVKASIAHEDQMIEANKQWIASSKAERGPLKEKYKKDKAAIKDGTYIPEGKRESLLATARRLSYGGDDGSGGHGREEFKVIFDYADLAADASQDLLQKASRRKLDRYEDQLVDRVDIMIQGIREFKDEDPEMALAYDDERNRLQGLLHKINPSKHTPPDIRIA
jgi:hypothetical protein